MCRSAGSGPVSGHYTCDRTAVRAARCSPSGAPATEGWPTWGTEVEASHKLGAAWVASASLSFAVTQSCGFGELKCVSDARGAG